MKKVLYGTTALATAGLLAAGANDANAAAQRIQVEVHGYMNQWLVGLDQDFTDNDPGDFRVGQGYNVSTIDQKSNAEVCFVGSTLLDNGITVGVNIQLEAEDVQGAGVDESFIFVQSDRFGQLKVGQEDPAADLLTVNAPDGGISIDGFGDLTTEQMFVNTAGANFGVVASTEIDRASDSNKFIYITPRYYGFQAGVDYTPQFGDDSNRASTTGPTGSFDEPTDGWSAALNYADVFPGGFGLRASAGIAGANQSTRVDPEDNNDWFAWRAGGQISYAGFTVGGAYKREYGNEGGVVNAGMAAGGPVPVPPVLVPTTGGGTVVVRPAGVAAGAPTTFLRNGQAWSIGGTYETGPYTVGVQYVQGSQVGWNIPGTGDIETKMGTVAGTYRLGPGIRLRAGFFWFDLEAEDVPDPAVAPAANLGALEAGIQNTSDSDGWGGAAAITASF